MEHEHEWEEKRKKMKNQFDTFEKYWFPFVKKKKIQKQMVYNNLIE